MKSYQIWNDDALERMAALGDGSIDAVIVDPPYGTTRAKWDEVIPFGPMWEQLERITKPGAAIVIFGTQPFTSALIMSRVEWFKYSWTWDKVRGIGHLVVKFRPMQRTEDVNVFGRGRITYNPQVVAREKPYKITRLAGKETELMGGRDVPHYERITTFRYPTTVLRYSRSPTKTRHPTEKPVALLDYLVRTHSNRGDVVLDFAMGTGTTGEAAVAAGRRFIGVEKDRDYYNMAAQRLERISAAMEGRAVSIQDERGVEDLPLFSGTVES